MPRRRKNVRALVLIAVLRVQGALDPRQVLDEQTTRRRKAGVSVFSSSHARVASTSSCYAPPKEGHIGESPDRKSVKSEGSDEAAHLDDEAGPRPACLRPRNRAGISSTPNPARPSDSTPSVSATVLRTGRPPQQRHLGLDLGSQPGLDLGGRIDTRHAHRNTSVFSHDFVPSPCGSSPRGMSATAPTESTSTPSRSSGLSVFTGSQRASTRSARHDAGHVTRRGRHPRFFGVKPRRCCGGSRRGFRYRAGRS